ncbi:ATP-binding protein [Paraburkholderia atlantica]|uniref:ATP-binding protein n=1 Tax=Paraburkholderia atlantica TaxID=2654982 RepID=UPI001EE63D7E|nr:ATP-binding protein [Paraburkholderia atlantica]
MIATESLFARWSASGLVELGDVHRFKFGAETYHEVSCSPSQLLVYLSDCRSPNSKSEAMAFATALRDTRAIDSESSLQGAVYVEKLSRILPTYETAAPADDGIVLGHWLTGGAQISAESFQPLRQMLTWIGSAALREVIKTAGIELVDEGAPVGANKVAHLPPSAHQKTSSPENPESSEQNAKRMAGVELGKTFELSGRSELEAFFNEHIVDIVRNKERYSALGIEFPAATVLHGPPGCGKTFAVEQLVGYLGWPCYQLDASTIASPFIHETSRKVSEMFEKAMQNAPSVLVIDEMEAFLADREAGGGASHHRVEEVAEFLRRIPEAAKNEVLIVAMTNRVEMIDPAIMRRGRFDHVVAVGYPDEAEVAALLAKLLAALPQDQTVDPAPLAKALAGRPLSDVAFVVREGARLSARAGSDMLGQEFLLAALAAAPSRSGGCSERRVGFV